MKFKIFIPIILIIMINYISITKCSSAIYIKFFGNEKIALSEKEIEKIIKLNKGKRPEPNTYLSYTYMKQHLLQFNDGISIIIGMEYYLKYTVYNNIIGREDNTCFVMPTYICDQIDVLYENKIEMFEKILNFPHGYFKKQNGLVRLDIKNISNLNLRIPSGNELGTNEYWIPGGYTIYGIPEAISDNIPLNKARIKIYYFTN